MSEEEVIDLVARTKVDMHLVECAEAREKFNKSLDNLYKLIRNLGVKIIVGLLGIIGVLITFGAAVAAKHLGWL